MEEEEEKEEEEKEEEKEMESSSTESDGNGMSSTACLVPPQPLLSVSLSCVVSAVGERLAWWRRRNRVWNVFRICQSSALP